MVSQKKTFKLTLEEYLSNKNADEEFDAKLTNFLVEEVKSRLHHYTHIPKSGIGIYIAVTKLPDFNDYIEYEVKVDSYLL